MAISTKGRLFQSTVFVRSATAVVLAALLLSGVSGLTTVPVAHGASITVTTFNDELHLNGMCSLREAVLAANRDQRVDSCRAGRGADQVFLRAGTYTLSVEGSFEDAGLTGDLDVTAPLSITGAGRDSTSIVADSSDRVLDFHGPVAAVVAGLAIIGRQTMSEDSQLENGGAIRAIDAQLLIARSSVTGTASTFPECFQCWSGEGGGIWYEGGKLTILNSEISGRAGAGGGAIGGTLGKVRIADSRLSGSAVYAGGAYEPWGTDSIIERTLIADTLTTAGSAITSGGPEASLVMRGSVMRDNVGGAIHSFGNLLVTDTTITRHAATDVPFGDFGAGIASFGTAVLRRVSVTDNHASQEAGGIVNLGRMLIEDSLVAGNSSTFGNGGIESTGYLTLVNSTVSGNSTSGGVGGLSMLDGVIRSSTIVGNSAGSLDGSGGAVLESVDVANSVFADNLDAHESPDCVGTGASLGYNLIENGSGCVMTGDTSTNLYGLDPMLGPLSDNGGSTLTHMPLAGSPLIDTASPLTAGRADAACPSRDQIGTRRPQDGDGDGNRRCDIGAIEKLP